MNSKFEILFKIGWRTVVTFDVLTGRCIYRMSDNEKNNKILIRYAIIQLFIVDYDVLFYTYAFLTSNNLTEI